MYLAPVGNRWLVPNILLSDTYPYGCGSGGSGALGVPGTVYPDLGTPVVPSTFCRLSFDHNLGSSRDHNGLDCSLPLAGSCGLGHSPLVFCRHTGPFVPADIVLPFGTVPLLVVARSGATCVGPVPLAG